MEYSQPFSFQDLLSFDDRNRAKADVMLLGYKPHHLWPSAWITEETDRDGRKLIEAVKQKWDAGRMTDELSNTEHYISKRQKGCTCHL